MAALHLNLHEIPQSSSIPRGHRHTCHLKRSPLSQLESPKIWEDLRQIVKSKVLIKWSMHVNASNADKLRYQLLPKSPEIQAGELAMDISETSCQQPAQCSTFSTSFDKTRCQELSRFDLRLWKYLGTYRTCTILYCMSQYVSVSSSSNCHNRLYRLQRSPLDMSRLKERTVWLSFRI